MFDCPDEACHEYRIIPADVAGVLLLEQRIDQHLKGGLGVSNEVIVLGGRLDESAEHHSVVGWMRDRALYVCPSHCFKADPATPVSFPGMGDDLPRLAEPFAPYRCQQGLLVGKMPI